MATPITRGPSDEPLSSPDPLNDTVSSALYPSSRRMTRSQRSQRLFSVGGSSTSPRKQMFELEVGDNRAPQRLLVTVEAEGDYENVGRRLFNSQTPTLRRGTTTTTVPLGGDKRVTAVKTPARRGRPPKAGGTPGTGPATGTATRKRAATPRKTPRQARRPRIGDSDALDSELTTTHGTPKSIMRRTTRASSRQPRGGSADPAPSTTRSRGRPKRVDFMPDDTFQTIEAEEYDALPNVAPSDDVLAAGMEEMAVDDPTPRREQATEVLPDSDIWMDEATPRPASQANTTLNRSPSPSLLPANTTVNRSISPSHLQDKSPTPSEQLASETGDAEPEYNDYNDYDFGPGAASDISSLVGDGDGDGDAGVDRQDMDTVAQGEDFSMIFANSIPSLRGNMSFQASGPEDFGEETSLIINKTLESLRQSGALRPDDDEDEDEVVGIPTGSSPEKEASRREEEEEETQHFDQTTHLEYITDPTEPNVEVVPDVTGEVNIESIVDVSAAVHDESIVDITAADESPLALPSWSAPRLRPRSAGSEATPSKSNRSPIRNPTSSRRKSIPLGRKLLESKARQMDDSYTSSPSKVSTGATPRKRASRRSSMAEEASVMYEDDFSEIPDEYLEAATPGRPKLPSEDAQGEEEDQVEDRGAAEDMPEEHNETVMEEWPSRPSPKSTVASNASMSFTRSDSGRMLTPDDTPSPNDPPVPESDGKTIEAPVTSPVVAVSSPLAERSQMSRERTEVRTEGMSDARSEATNEARSEARSERSEVRSEVRGHARSSSLPVGDLTANLPGASNEYITPVGPSSSPIPSPDVNLLAPRGPSPDGGIRPTLSPIVRAGRALQSVTSDASSPPRQNSLGSPFRPTTSSSQPQPQSATKSRSSWTQPLSNLIQAGAQFFQSPTRQAAPPARPQSAGQLFEEDPFGAENSHMGQPSFMEALTKSMRSSPTRQPEATASESGSLRAAPPDEADEMSWMHEEPAPREQPFALSRSVNTSMEVIGEPSNSQQPSQQPSFDNGDETEVEEMAEDQEMEDEEEDIWVVEASRPASQSSRQHSVGKQSVRSIASQRAVKPSPWKQGDLSPKKQIFTPVATQPRRPTEPEAEGEAEAEAEAEDYSMLSQQRVRQQQFPQKSLQTVQSSAKKDLSAFFSSPALLPGAEDVRNILDVKRRQNALAEKERSSPEQPEAGLQTNTMFPSIPQKAFNPSASGRSDLFSPAKSSAVKPTQPTPDARRELFASTRSKGLMRQASEIPDSQPGMSSEITFPSVAQKKNFTPRSGQKSQSLFSKASAPVPSLTPVRMQLTRADIKKWQEDSASAIAVDSPESPRQNLRPLPDRNLSPTKSCLRSPLKPRTPGRVVEFTSSVLSPLAQAQARAERRMSASSNGSASQQQQQQQRVAIAEEENKENDVMEQDESQDADVSMTDAPESSPPKPVEARLSQTMWSRDHWLLLDELIQLRRRGPFNFQWPAGFQSKSGWLLGKCVNSHGASLAMGQWHLDVVDAFKAEVGGWEEEVLAKRVFSLVVGEQLRKEGRAPKAPSVKFV
ncbi:hypothetical protein CMUS01_08739 [Colletotrichum musicola]|uniref:Uncharacterized protein n=1 Tax=Colletotrichum musicola TaxID=2175873 RepID=A0A8H6KAZ3_9PEZI|nr:hypothetical protein CMUS01_08739 [Colletotrichum musicola]